MSFNTISTSDRGVEVAISDSVCGTSTHSFDILEDWISFGAIICKSPDGVMAHINYYSIDATSREYINLKSCTASVFTGVAANVTYCG